MAPDSFAVFNSPFLVQQSAAGRRCDGTDRYQDPKTIASDLSTSIRKLPESPGALAHEIKTRSRRSASTWALAEDFANCESQPRQRGQGRGRSAPVPPAPGTARQFSELRQGPQAQPGAEQLNLQVKQAIDFFAPKAARAEIEIVDYLAPRLALVLSRESFHGALLNLVLNAEQAMPTAANWWHSHKRPSAAEWSWT